MLHTLVAFLSDLFIQISRRPVEIKMTVGRRKGSSPTTSKCSQPVDVKVEAYDCAQRSSDSPDSLFRLQVKKQCRYASGKLSWHSSQVGLVVGIMWQSGTRIRHEFVSSQFVALLDVVLVVVIVSTG